MIEVIPGVSWYRPEEIIEAAAECEAQKKSLTSEQLLMLLSTSFFLPTKLLTTERGKVEAHEEADKEAEVRCAYNFLRFVDTQEDLRGLEHKDRLMMLERSPYVIGEVTRLNGSSKTLRDIIEGDEMRTIVKTLLEKGKPNEAERVFIHHFGMGPVLEELYSFDKEVRSYIHYCVESMATGMSIFLKHGELQNMEQLENYRYQVAGSIGERFLTPLVKKKDGVELDGAKAAQLGGMLQTVNILKNMREDYLEGRVYLPASLRPSGVSHQYMMDDEGVKAEEARKKVLSDMFDLVKKDMPHAFEYIASIPSHLSGYRAFCLLPTILACETVRTMKYAVDTMKPDGLDRIFAGDQKVIKIQYGMEKGILPFVRKIVHHDDGNRLGDWLNEYLTKHERYSFEPQSFEEWSGKFFKNRKPLLSLKNL